MKDLPVNIDELSFVLHRGEEMKMECYLDLRNGSILNIPTNETLTKKIYGKTSMLKNINPDFFISQIISGKDYLLYIPDHFNNHVYNLTSSFTESLLETDFPKINNLVKIIQRGGEYSEFHSILVKNYELYDIFIAFRDKLYEKLAREWLSENNINPIMKDNSKTFH